MSRDGKRMAVYGKSGSGKSFYAKSLLGSFTRIVVFDPEDEYGDLPGFIRVENKADFLEVLQDCWEGTFKVAFVPRDLREEEDLHQVSRLIEKMQAPYLNEENDKKVTLLVDELNLSFPLNPKPEYSGFARLVSKGRKRGINIIGISQRPAEVGPRFRGNLDRVACFAMSFDNDFVAVGKLIGSKAENAVRDLKDKCYVFWENGDWKEMQPVK